MDDVREPRSVLVHIGWPKSGTTSIQTQLRAWPNLAGKPIERPGGHLAATVWNCLLSAPEFDIAAFDGLIEQSTVDRARPVVASFEAVTGVAFTHHRKGGHLGPAVVAERLERSSHRLAILATVRSAREMLRSTYLQEVSKGSPQDYGQFLRAVRTGRMARTHPFAFAETLQAFNERFGVANVVVVSLSNLVDAPEATWAAIAQRTDMPQLATIGSSPLSRSNPSTLLGPRTELFVNRHILPVGSSTVADRVRRSAYSPIRRRLARGLALDETWFASGQLDESELAAEIDEEIGRLLTQHWTATSPTAEQPRRVHMPTRSS